MPRSRSNIVKKAAQGWQGIHCIASRSVLQMSEDLKDFFETKIKAPSQGRPLEIEVGSGHGDFLVHAARMHEQRFFVGIEYANKFVRYIRDRIEKAGLHNVTLIRADAKLLFKHLLPEHSVSAVHVYFPDPWLKKRHRKKRFLSEDGLTVLCQKLIPGGLIYFVTDNLDYFTSVQATLANHRFELEVIYEKMHSSSEAPNAYLAYEGQSHFGQKWLRQGRSIYQMTLRSTIKSKAD